MRLGDHIKVNRLAYTHHGIVTEIDGDGIPTKVVHFIRDPARESFAIVRETSFARFSKDSDSVHAVPHEYRYRRDKVVERARSMIGHFKYNVVISNCEDIALWAITGRTGSKQVHAVGESCAVVGFLVMAIGIILMSTRRSTI